MTQAERDTDVTAHRRLFNAITGIFTDRSFRGAERIRTGEKYRLNQAGAGILSAGIYLILILSLMSCQTGKELHYFKESGNFYRLKVTEGAFLSSSRFLSGYFDEKAVESFFDEIKRTDSTASLKSHAINIDLKCPSNEKGKLVMILSTQSDMVAANIGAIARSEMTFELIARLANKDLINENEELSESIEDVAQSKQYVIEIGSRTIMGISSPTEFRNRKTVENALLDFVNETALRMGAARRFTNLNEAEIWFAGKLTP